MTFAIRCENIGKSYAINQAAQHAGLLRDVLADGVRRLTGRPPQAPRKQAQQLWALRDVQFEVQPGERIGIIGANGAGKSTLLKIISRVTHPTEGRVETRGKLASLLEVGTGFHPDLTGRENIFLNGAILGMSHREIKSKLDKIIDFSGIESFIDTPVKYYSSGMYVRLAFSVSAWVDPDILILDEVLSVGDAVFQRKSAERMRELTQEGRTVIYVSHSMASVRQMCNKALYLEKGRVVSFESVDEAASDYQEEIQKSFVDEGPWHRAEFKAEDPEIVFYKDHTINPSNHVRCLHGAVLNLQNNPAHEHALNEPITTALDYEVTEDLPHGLVPNIHIYDGFGGRVFVSMPSDMFSGKAGRYQARCVIPPFHLNKGRYSVGLSVSAYQLENPVYFAATDALRFEVFETLDMDDRRHGWLGDLPGVSRPRLNWSFSRL